MRFRNFLPIWSCRFAKFKRNHLKLLQEELNEIENHIKLRDHPNNIPIIRNLINKLKVQPEWKEIIVQLRKELIKLPNQTHRRLLEYDNQPKTLYLCDVENMKQSAVEFSNLCDRMHMLRMKHLGNYSGHKSYYYYGKLAELESALIQYSLSLLKSNGFRIISVPDILPKSVIRACGMQTDGNRTQIYKLDSGYCLSGTSEMALGGFYANQLFRQHELPIKVAAVSRCYRAETSAINEEKGTYRVHQFTKVEMFCICNQQQSEEMIEHFKDVELSIFNGLNLKLRVLDMPPNELGASAYQKYDIESWMAGRGMWGEISSCSNCTDYQAKRLNIRYLTEDKQIKYAHTVNGTAAAIPRLLIALIETHQNSKQTVTLPSELLCYLNGTELCKETAIPEIKLNKSIQSNI